MAAPLAVNIVDVPLQIETFDPALTTGTALTVIVCTAVLTQPAALVPVTVYDVVAVGLAVIVVPVVAERPVDGAQEKEDAALPPASGAVVGDILLIVPVTVPLSDPADESAIVLPDASSNDQAPMTPVVAAAIR